MCVAVCVCVQKIKNGIRICQQSLHPLLRTSQVSLSSNPETDFRYSAIYGTIGVYKGRIFAIKMVNKKSIDMTRSMKKELKWVRDAERNFLLGRLILSQLRMMLHLYAHTK